MFAIQSDYDPLAYAAYCDNAMQNHFTRSGFDAPQQEGTAETNGFQRLATEFAIQDIDVDIDVRQFRHGRQADWRLVSMPVGQLTPVPPIPQ